MEYWAAQNGDSLEQLFEHPFFTKNLDIPLEFSTKNKCGNNKQCHVTLFASVWHVKLGTTIFLTFPLIMRSITPAQCSTMITLLQEGYTYSKIHTKTGLWKATISRVKADALENKENNPAGHPSKLTTCDKQSIIHQISTGRLAAPSVYFTHYKWTN